MTRRRLMRLSIDLEKNGNYLTSYIAADRLRTKDRVNHPCSGAHKQLPFPIVENDSTIQHPILKKSSSFITLYSWCTLRYFYHDYFDYSLNSRMLLWKSIKTVVDLFISSRDSGLACDVILKQAPVAKNLWIPKTRLMLVSYVSVLNLINLPMSTI